MDVGPLDLGRAAEVGLGTTGSTRQRMEPGFTGAIRPYPCSGDDIYCIVEEYTFF